MASKEIIRREEVVPSFLLKRRVFIYKMAYTHRADRKAQHAQ